MLGVASSGVDSLSQHVHSHRCILALESRMLMRLALIVLIVFVVVFVTVSVQESVSLDFWRHTARLESQNMLIIISPTSKRALSEVPSRENGRGIPTVGLGR